jgi:DNA mismatch repair protein MutS
MLDEIGRGTSTYDGISIAWAIAEYLHQNPQNRHPLTLFATHYHELNEMAATFERIKNYHITTREADGRIIFLRKFVAGGSEHSFGIHVARMAGLPAAITARATEILADLENRGRQGQITSAVATTATGATTVAAQSSHSACPTPHIVPTYQPAADDPANYQLSLFQLTDLDDNLQRIKQELQAIDINSLSPIEALNKLNEIKKLL